jgi:exonuclease SbcC
MLERLAEERPAGEARLATAQRSEAQADTRAREEARLLAEAEQRAASVRDLGPEAPCPTCARPLGEHQALLLHGFAAEIQRRREALAALASAREAAGREAAAARQTLVDQAAREQELQRKAQALAREESRRDAAVASLAAASARAERLRAQAAALKAEPFDPRASDAALAEVRRLEQIQAQHARAAAAAERADEIARILAELDASAAAARAAEAAARARRDALQFDAAAHDALERACGEAESRLLQARLERERAAAEAQLRAAEEARLAAELAQQEALAARAAALEARATRLEHVAGILPEFKDHLIGRIRPLLSAHAGRLFRELTDGRYADLEVAEDYDLLVNDDGKTFPLTRFSGGEADLANLCLRLAVSQVVAERAGVEDFAFLALDEVFGSQDEVRKGNILRTLRALGGRFRQIVLVTHVDDVKDAAEGVLRVRALDDGTSEVVSESGG